MPKQTLLLLLILILAVGLNAQETTKEDVGLRVLLVAHDPEAPSIPFASSATSRTYALYRERTAAFEALLRYHFKHVKVVYGADYTSAISDNFDVTVFDARPKALSPSSRNENPTTGEIDFKPARYLPESFNRASLTISDNSPRIGEPLGLKLDWL
ncbi:MAG: hypothetical protein ACI97A_002828 [Planctomycetota bacterium]|jgi:hypothetical protein